MPSDRDTADTADTGCTEAQAGVAPVDVDQRVEARRRFLKGGAGGSAMLMLTVTHKRAFAGKKGSVASACTSLQGTPDIKGINTKKALEASAMGTPKGLICRPRDGVDPNRSDAIPGVTKESRYLDSLGNRVPVYDLDNLKQGLGDIQTTLNYSSKARLYDKGYCPVKIDANGVLQYDHSAVYYKRAKDSGLLVEKACKPTPGP